MKQSFENVNVIISVYDCVSMSVISRRTRCVQKCGQFQIRPYFSISDKACSGICPAAVRLLSGHYLWFPAPSVSPPVPSAPYPVCNCSRGDIHRKANLLESDPAPCANTHARLTTFSARGYCRATDRTRKLPLRPGQIPLFSFPIPHSQKRGRIRQAV